MARTRDYAWRVCSIAIGVAAVLTTLLLANEPTSSSSHPATAASMATSVPTAAARSEAASLFAIAKGQHSEPVSAQRAAAKLLAAHIEGESWVVLLLTDARLSAVPSGDSDEQARAEAMRPFRLAVTAAAIQGLSVNAGKPVLWALTLLLDEQGEGRWSEKSGTVTQTQSEHRSPPIRDLARDCLKKRLGVDHGWDAPAWQDAILKVNDRRETDTKPKAER